MSIRSFECRPFECRSFECRSFEATPEKKVKKTNVSYNFTEIVKTIKIKNVV